MRNKLKKLLFWLDFPEIKALWNLLTTPLHRTLREFISLEKCYINVMDDNVALRKKLDHMAKVIDRMEHAACRGYRFTADCQHCGALVTMPCTPFLRFEPDGTGKQVCASCAVSKEWLMPNLAPRTGLSFGAVMQKLTR